MKRMLAALSLVAAVTVASPVRASDSGLSFGLRVGYGFGMGDVIKDPDTGVPLALSDGISGEIPIWLDAGYRFNPSLYLGAYFQYAPAFPKDCSGCSASNTRLGANLLYHFSPGAGFDPWAGIGFGYEWLNLGVSGIDAGYNGWEFVNLQLGGDFPVGQGFTLGPYLVFSLAQYGTVTATVSGQSGSASIPSGFTTLHEWFQFGIKGTFNL